jgi:hypothetical protein
VKLVSLFCCIRTQAFSSLDLKRTIKKEPDLQSPDLTILEVAAILSDDPEAFTDAFEALQKQPDGSKRDPRLFVYQPRRRNVTGSKLTPK